jgi:5'(3')-deoxyribonucleotidase
MYNEKYKNHPRFKEAKWYLVEDWNFTKQCPLAGRNTIDEFFNSPDFFNEKLEFMENAYEIINILSNTYDFYVTSMGNDKNLIYKETWIKNNLPCIKGFIGVNFKEYDNKSHIDMSESIFADDCSHNLETSNCECPILYGDIFDWNRDYKGRRFWNWMEIYTYLME